MYVDLRPWKKQEAIGHALVRRYEASQRRELVSIENGWNHHLPGLADWTRAHLAGQPSPQLSADYVSYRADGSIDRVIEVKTKRRSTASSVQTSISMVERQLTAARVIGAEYWLYVAFGCETPEPVLVVLPDPGRLDWRTVTDAPENPGARKGSVGAERRLHVMPSEVLAAGQRVTVPPVA